MGLFKKILPVLGLTALSLFPKNANANPLEIDLFPEMPVYRSAMADSDIPKTEINLPLGLEQNLLDKSIKELIPYVSLGKEIPLISVNIKSKKPPKIIPSEVVEGSEIRAFAEGRKLSDKVLSASLVVGGSLRFPENENPKYTAKAELFLDSPMIDDYTSDGNQFFLVAGFKGDGSIRTENIEEMSIKSLPEIFSMNSYSFSGDLYIVAKSPYSKQFLILRAGIDNLFGKTAEKPNIILSSTWEFPPLMSWLKMFRNFKLLPYLSINVKIPLDNAALTKASGELGAKLTGESKKSVMVYGRADYNNLEGMKYSTGLKLDL